MHGWPDCIRGHWVVNHQETWPYGLRDFTLGVVSSWDLDDAMDLKS